MPAGDLRLSRLSTTADGSMMTGGESSAPTVKWSRPSAWNARRGRREEGHAAMQRTVAWALAGLVALGHAGPANALGRILCGSPEAADTFDISNDGANEHGIFLIVAGTSEILGGAALDPRIEIRRLSDGAVIACNDDNGLDFGGCSAQTTMDMRNFTFNQGPNPLYRIGDFDSAVFFINPPGGVRVTVRGSTQPASGMSTCGWYTVHIFGF
jgi:hypothetical protein